jgi:hypothetical protein
MKEKIIEIVGGVLNYLPWGEITPHTAEDIADRLIEHGVTFATGNNVGDKWISVKDRLPKGNKPGEVSENVIVCTTDGEVTTGWLDALGSDKWWLVIGTDDSHTCWGLGYVTHWMPLPEPPKEENDG